MSSHGRGLPSSIAGLRGSVDNNLKVGFGLNEARRELLSGTGFAARPEEGEESILEDFFSSETHRRLMESLYRYPYLDFRPER